MIIDIVLVVAVLIAIGTMVFLASEDKAVERRETIIEYS